MELVRLDNSLKILSNHLMKTIITSILSLVIGIVIASLYWQNNAIENNAGFYDRGFHWYPNELNP